MDKIKLLVKDDLSKIENNLKTLITPDNEPICDLSKFIQENSKRIRSILSLLYLKANNVDVNNDVINLLTASELIHNASLIHDDIVDNSEIRRGKQSLFGKYDSKLSVLLGDYTLSYAIKHLLLIDNRKILDIFLEVTKKMSNAEIIQYTNRNSQPKIEDYIDIIKGKTASLFAGTLECLAILTQINSQKAKNIGELFGIIFQINNDQNHDSMLNDTKNGVYTATNILGIEKTQALKDNYKQELRELLIEIPDNIYKQGIEGLINLL